MKTYNTGKLQVHGSSILYHPLKTRVSCDVKKTDISASLMSLYATLSFLCFSSFSRLLCIYENMPQSKHQRMLPSSFPLLRSWLGIVVIFLTRMLSVERRNELSKCYIEFKRFLSFDICFPCFNKVEKLRTSRCYFL